MNRHNNVNISTNRKQWKCMSEIKVVFWTQINIDCVTRKEIIENISQPGPNCFDRAQRLIYGLMENDCYPRFLKSEIYQALLEQAEQQWKQHEEKSLSDASEWLILHFSLFSLESQFKQKRLVCQRKQKWKEIQSCRYEDWQDLKAKHDLNNVLSTFLK